MSPNGCLGFFLFCLDLELFAKIKKRSGLYSLPETRFINNSRSKQNLKKSQHNFVDISKSETCTKFQQKLLKSIIVGAAVFSFSDK